MSYAQFPSFQTSLFDEYSTYPKVQDSQEQQTSEYSLFFPQPVAQSTPKSLFHFNNNRLHLF